METYEEILQRKYPNEVFIEVGAIELHGMLKKSKVAKIKEVSKYLELDSNKKKRDLLWYIGIELSKIFDKNDYINSLSTTYEIYKILKAS